jgi:ADP-ribose pyrophosphatase
MAKFDVVSSKRVLQTKIFDVWRERASGPHGAKFDREIVKHPGAAVMLARDSEGRVLLIRQFRLPLRKQLWELPAGRIDSGENPLQAARRELKEETGYSAKRWKKIFSFYPSPGFCDEKMTAFLAQDLSEGDSDPEPYELIEKRFYDWDETVKMIASGRIKDSKTIATLLFVDRFGDG